MKLKGIFLMSILLAFLALSMGCTSSDDSGIEVATSPTIDIYKKSTRVTTPTPDDSSISAELELSIGQSATTSKQQVTVFSARKTSSYTWTGSTSSYTFTEKATSGKTFILVEAEIKNIGSDRMYASAGDFSISDSEGNRYDPELYAGEDALGLFQELYKNQKVKGKVVFEIPTSADNLILYYDFGDIISGTRLASWKIP
jgi:hypothetical protein